MQTLVLDATTKTIAVKMSGAPATTNPDFVAAWADDNGTTLVEGASDGALNGSSNVTVVAAPAAATRRIIKFISIQNRDTAPVTLTIQYDDNGTFRNMAVVTLAVGDTWTTDGTYDTTGALKGAWGLVSLVSGVTGILPIANGGTGASTLAGASIPTYTSTVTLTNKRITRRLVTVNAPGATPSTNTDNVDIANFTGLATAITSMTTNLTGTPVDGDLVEFRFTDNGTARAITWGASFGSTTVTLPTTTVISTMLRVLVEWNGSIWQCIAVA